MLPVDRDEVQSVLDGGDEIQQPLLNDNSIMDLSQSLRASSASQLRARYLRSVESGVLSNSVSKLLSPLMKLPEGSNW